MNEAIRTIIESRVSSNYFDANQVITDTAIEELVRLATRAPSAYNFQNWKFIAVRSFAAKSRLAAAAFGQQKIRDAAVSFIICGTLKAYEQLPAALAPAVDAGLLPRAVAESWASAARDAHAGNPQLQRDEAFRSGSLAAMVLMLAAEGMGLTSCPMSGFDPEAVSREFGLSPGEVPVMLVAVGHASSGKFSQKPRRAVHDVLSYK